MRTGLLMHTPRFGSNSSNVAAGNLKSLDQGSSYGCELGPVTRVVGECLGTGGGGKGEGDRRGGGWEEGGEEGE